MSKQLKQLLIFLAVLIIIVASLGYGVVTGAKNRNLEETVMQNEQEIKQLHAGLKSYSSLLLERDIKLHEKDSTIQQLAAQNEGLTWQLQNGEGE